jgi:hypothetical protein
MLRDDFGQSALCEQGGCLAPATARVLAADNYGGTTLQFRCFACADRMINERIREQRAIREDMRQRTSQSRDV